MAVGVVVWSEGPVPEGRQAAGADEKVRQH